MRKTRSVAWSSTAGFHQRERWITWFAAVSVKPTPPALGDSDHDVEPELAALELLHGNLAGLTVHSAMDTSDMMVEAVAAADFACEQRLHRQAFTEYECFFTLRLDRIRGSRRSNIGAQNSSK